MYLRACPALCVAAVLLTSCQSTTAPIDNASPSAAALSSSPSSFPSSPMPTSSSSSEPAWETFQKPSADVLKKELTPEQYEVTQEEGTEPPFQNAYWNNHEDGIYVDIVSGEPLFSSKDKFESGTGWPSFTRPLDPDNIVERADNQLLMQRTEVRSKHADSHLGHVFDDGPQPTGLRFCMNSASLRFIPKADLEKDGYGEYSKLFE